MARKRLVLFDIDGTMVDTGGAGMDSLCQGLRIAFPDQTRHQSFPKIQLGGATDCGLVETIFPAFGIEVTGANQRLFFDSYCKVLSDSLKQAAAEQRGFALVGVVELVATLANHPDCYLGLLTGNIETAARIKLQTFGLSPDLFPIGAYGDDFADRNKLGPVAVERAEAFYQQTFDSSEVWIIGDTTKDIACARAFDARVIAVATGADDVVTLSNAKPDQLVDDFSDYHQVVKLILN